VPRVVGRSGSELDFGHLGERGKAELARPYLSPKGLSVLTLPPVIMACLSPFAPVVSRPVWRHVQALLVEAILAPGGGAALRLLR
jgi:hypothetical protein